MKITAVSERVPYFLSKNVLDGKSAKFSFNKSSKINLSSKANEIRAFISFDTRQSNEPAHR